MQSAMRAVFVLMILNTVSCGIIKDRSNEYSEAETGKTLIVPEGLSDQKIRARYPVPVIENLRVLPKDFELPEPPNATAAYQNDPFLIETVKGQTWLRLYTAPGKIWPLLDFFWSEYGIEVAFEEISKGHLVTKPYKQLDVSPSLTNDLNKLSEKLFSLDGLVFQAKLNQGVRRNTSELQLRAFMPSSELNADPEKKTSHLEFWVSQSTNPELENAMLSLIGGFVTSDTLENRYSLLANDIGGESLVRLLQDDESENYLELLLTFDRAWNEVGKALNSAGVVVSDFDRSERVYYVSYLQEDDLHGWFELESTANERRKERNFSLELEVVNEGKTIVRVKLLNPGVDPEKQYELLNVVFEHIS